MLLKEGVTTPSTPPLDPPLAYFKQETQIEAISLL